MPSQEVPASDEELQLLHGFAAATLNAVREARSLHPWEPRRRRFIRFAADGDWDYEEFLDADYLGFFKEHLYNDAFWTNPAVVAFARWFHAHPEKPGPRTTDAYKGPFEEANTFVITDLLFIVRDYLRRGGSLEVLNHELVSACWREVCELCCKPRVRSCFLIEGLRVNEPIDLGPFGTLSPVTADSKTEQFRYKSWDHGLCPPEFAARAQAQLVPPTTGDIPFNRAASIVLTSLRLSISPKIFARGPVLWPTTDRLSVGWSFSPLTDFTPPWRDPGVFSFDDIPVSEISTAKVQDLRDTCDHLHGRAFDLFRVGFRRFNQSLRRHDLDDRIVDLAIVLESTLLAGINNELFWRAQILGAALLRTRLGASTARYQIRALYSARSLIVHDGIVLREVLDRPVSGELRKKTRDIRRVASGANQFDALMISLSQAVLRELLDRFSSLGSPDELPNALEELVLSSEIAAPA